MYLVLFGVSPGDVLLLQTCTGRGHVPLFRWGGMFVKEAPGEDAGSLSRSAYACPRTHELFCFLVQCIPHYLHAMPSQNPISEVNIVLNINLLPVVFSRFRIFFSLKGEKVGAW